MVCLGAMRPAARVRLGTTSPPTGMGPFLWYETRWAIWCDFGRFAQPGPAPFLRLFTFGVNRVNKSAHRYVPGGRFPAGGMLSFWGLMVYNGGMTYDFKQRKLARKILRESITRRWGWRLRIGRILQMIVNVLP